MPALTKPIPVSYGPTFTLAEHYNVPDGVQVFRGGQLEFTPEGWVAPVTAASGRNYAGVALNSYNNLTGVTETTDKPVQVMYGSSFYTKLLVATESDVGGSVYATSDGDLTFLDGPGNVLVGKLQSVDPYLGSLIWQTPAGTA